MDLSEERPLVVVMRSATGQNKQVIIVSTTIVNINFTCHDYDFPTFCHNYDYLSHRSDLFYKHDFSCHNYVFHNFELSYVMVFYFYVIIKKTICLIVDLVFHNFDLVPHNYGLIIFFYFMS